MHKLGVVLGLTALAVAGYGLLQAGDTDAQIESLARSNGDLRDQITSLEARLDAAEEATGGSAFLTSDPAADASTAHADDVAGLATRKPVTALERLAKLEALVTEQNERLAKFDERESAVGQVSSAMRGFQRDRFYGNVDMAAKSMKLDERQKTDLQDAIERAQAELADLYKIENDEGVTWDQVRKPKMVEGSGFTFSMPDMGKVQKFKKGRIPGSSETFGQAESRIRKDAFGRMRNLLTPEQAKKWDKAHKDALLRGGGGGMSIVTSFAEPVEIGK